MKKYKQQLLEEFEIKDKEKKSQFEIEVEWCIN